MNLVRLLALVLRRVARTGGQAGQHGKVCGNMMEARLWCAMINPSKRPTCLRVVLNELAAVMTR